MKQDLLKLLKGNRYPGRGILLGKSPDGASGVIAYFIMGRSANSRNRVFETTEDGIRTKAFDESAMEDPSLIIYHPVRRMEDGTIIVTNGDQTDSIKDAFADGKCWRHALMRRTFEPDGPNWTPRISGLLFPDGSRKMSILKSLDGDSDCACRYFFEYENPPAGAGHFLSTYVHDGNPLPSFEGEPVFCGITQTSARELSDELWEALDRDNRISLYTAWVNLAGGDITSVIRNANGSQEPALNACGV